MVEDPFSVTKNKAGKTIENYLTFFNGREGKLFGANTVPGLISHLRKRGIFDEDKHVKASSSTGYVPRIDILADLINYDRERAGVKTRVVISKQGKERVLHDVHAQS